MLFLLCLFQLFEAFIVDIVIYFAYPAKHNRKLWKILTIINVSPEY